MIKFWQRLQSKTPVLWARIRNIAISINTAVAAVWVLNTSMNLNLPPVMIDICKYTLVVCTFLITYSQQKTTDPNLK